MREQTRHLFACEDLRQALGHLRHRDLIGELLSPEDHREEKPDRAGRLIDARVGELLLGNQVQQVGLDRRRIEAVRRASIVLGQSNDAAQVGLLRALGEAPQHHRVVHPLAQLAHLVLLIRIGNSPDEKDRSDGSPLQSASPHMPKALPIQQALRGGPPPRQRFSSTVINRALTPGYELIMLTGGSKH